MTDMSKYKNVSLTKETYAILEKLSKILLLLMWNKETPTPLTNKGKKTE